MKQPGNGSTDAMGLADAEGASAAPMVDRVFPGDSEMARRMRELDWSKTSLGPVEQWPQSLLTSVSTCLDCAFPIVIWWGPDLAILYNDEYRPVLGPAKHPGALGECGANVWAEIWDVIGPMLSQVMERGEATRSRDLLLHIDRGYPEEAYFSFSYSPIRAEQGKVGGIFCPVIETTQKVIGERRLHTLRDLAAECQGAQSEAVAYQSAAKVLALNPHDVPFALIYRIDQDQSVALLEATAGIEPAAAAAPRSVSLKADHAGIWSLSAVAHSGSAAVVDPSGHFDVLPTGAWKVPAHSVLVLPVLLPGQERPRAILVAAVSPMRALDEDYRTFFELVATQIASGLADAQALEEERRRAESLAKIDRAKTAFFSNVSHEFRTPLTLMLGPLEDALANVHGILPKNATVALGVAHRNSLRLLKLVNTLLDFSRMEAGRVEANYEPTDLAACTVELASVFRSAIEKAGLQLIVDCPRLPEPVYVDRDMWEKVVLNLLSNAFKFTFAGAITVALRWRSERAELSVRDTGVGVPESDLPKIFQRFYRVKKTPSRTHEGTGIGLALVQELARLHGGEVTAQSEEGRGTTFTVSIPTGNAHLPPDRISVPRQLTSTSVGATPFVEEALRWLPEKDEDGGLDDETLAEMPETSLKSARATESVARVLVADDNADMRDYLRRLLGRSYAVETVAEGQAALERIQASPPDLVLADVMMPRLDGFGLLAAIRTDERTRALPVILLSARAGEEARIEGLKAGADEYLIKPFSARELLARVASQLELARVRREAEQALRDADRRKDEFLAMLAHELRNPLAPIKNGIQILKVARGKPEALERTREMMERQILQMVRLIDDLLEVSRISQGKITLNTTRVELASVVYRSIETCRPLLDDMRHELTISLPPQPIYLEADSIRLSQVLSNLVNNACKFTPPGGQIQLRVECGGDRLEDQLLISVKDNGVGIPPEMLPRVFDLFVQVDRSLERSQGGLGIGLTLVRRLVELHRGTVEARSTGVGCGSEFLVRLPLAEGAVDSQRTEQLTSTAGPRDGARHILIADDNRDSADSLATVLASYGNVVHTAYDGIEAIELAVRLRPDVVLLDIAMPRLNGYDAALRMRTQLDGTDMVLIAVTGFGQHADKRRSEEVGFDGHLVKPVDYTALMQLLAGLQFRATVNGNSAMRAQLASR